ncbi:energy transducer TonB [Sinomicrobium sp. M5D2P9]
MIPKKNPKADLARNSGLFFVIGMAIVLFLTWKGMEWKEYDKTKYIADNLSVPEQPEEIDIPVIRLNTPPPPPPPKVIADKIVLEEDDSDTKDSKLIPIEDSFDDPVDVDDIPVIDDPVPDEMISINLVENVPVFPGCENAEDKRKCFEENMMRHIRKNFRYPELAKEREIQGKVYVNFVIDKDGNITGIQMRGPDKSLEEEAARIINKLPKMTPGKQGNRAVRVPFSIPITFKLQ